MWSAPRRRASACTSWLVNARDVKYLPGRPKTDKLDAVWLCKVAERQMLRPSFVPPKPIRQLRDLTRYRIDLLGARTAEKNRVEKLLEDAFNGHFDNHHAFLLTRMLGRIDAIDADIAAVDAQIEAQLAPFAAAAARLDDIPGVGPVAAAIILAEVGVEMSRFPTAGHLCSWAKFSPGICSSAGKSKGNGSSGHGNRYLARVLGEAAVVVGRTDTFLGERYRRIAKRRGKKRAIVAVGRSILVIVWHLLSDEQAVFNDLGADHFTRHVNSETKKRNHIRQLEALGYTVTLTPAA